MTNASPRAHRAFIGLGGNLDSPRPRVLAVFDALAAMPGVALLARSSLYASSPVGVIDQPDFINAVAEIDTTLEPVALLEALLAIEHHAGRVRGERFGPRTLDIDILLFDDVMLDVPHLTLPHPRMHERAFVLRPLLEIAPDALIPGKGRAASLLESVTHQMCEKTHD